MKRAALLTALLLVAALLCACAAGEQPAETTQAALSWADLEWESSLELEYATEFTVDYYTGGYALIHISDGYTYLVVPQDCAVPADLDPEWTILQQPLDRIYLVATSAMDLYRAIDGIGSIRLSGLEASGWYIEEARQAMEDGDILYAGKYSAPDYELIYSEGCDLAVESTMIYHSPEVKEQLEKLGIPVLVERSSYESHPLGRMEWMKLHAVLLDKEELAQELFRQELEALEPVLEQPGTGKTVAFFSITSTGSVTVRKSGDYVAKTIALAGGEYVFSDLGDEDNALSTVNMQMEAFYDGARDADCLIYNSTITGELETLEDLLTLSPLLADFAAVQSGNVWCTGQNLFQESMGLGGLILDIHTVLTADSPEDLELTYLHRLQ